MARFATYTLCSAVKSIQPEGIVRKTVEEADRAATYVTTPVGGFRFAYAKSESGNTNFLIEHPLKCEDDFKILMWMEEHTRYEPNPELVTTHFQGGPFVLANSDSCPPGVSVEKFKLVADVAKRRRI